MGRGHIGCMLREWIKCMRQLSPLTRKLEQTAIVDNFQWTKSTVRVTKEHSRKYTSKHVYGWCI